MCPTHPLLRQRNVDNICETGKRLGSFHVQCIGRILGVTWREHTSNKDVLEHADIPSMFALLSQRRLRLLGRVCRMDNGRIPKDVLYSELASGARCLGRPALRFRDAYKRNIKSAQISIESCESAVADCKKWRQAVQRGMRKAEKTNCGRRRETVREKDHRLPHLYIKLSTPVPSVAGLSLKNRTFGSQRMLCKPLMSHTAQHHYLSR